MAFMTAAPIVLTQTFQLSASGQLTTIMVSGSAIIGNLSASRLPQSISLQRRLLLGSIAGFIFSLIALTLSLVNAVDSRNGYPHDGIQFFLRYH
jgi:DHA1 family bicyclomycin/chloramphenicol resistance-like MFS transporter